MQWRHKTEWNWIKLIIGGNYRIKSECNQGHYCLIVKSVPWSTPETSHLGQANSSISSRRISRGASSACIWNSYLLLTILQNSFQIFSPSSFAIIHSGYFLNHWIRTYNTHTFLYSYYKSFRTILLSLHFRTDNCRWFLVRQFVVVKLCIVIEDSTWFKSLIQ